MDKYIYLILSSILLCIWFGFFLLRRDLRSILLRVSILGGLAGLVSEIWYFSDYWRPPSVLGNAKISIEDFLFGFALTGIAATIYKIILSKKSIKQTKNRKKIFLMFFIIGVVLLLFFINLLKINSIFVSSFAFILFSLIIVFIRKDLLLPSILSGLFSLLIMLPIYIFLNFLSPDFLKYYWLLSNTIWGIKIFGNIPLTELLWYFAWGSLAGIAYEFYNGNVNSQLD